MTILPVISIYPHFPFFLTAASPPLNELTSSKSPRSTSFPVGSINIHFLPFLTAASVVSLNPLASS